MQLVAVDKLHKAHWMHRDIKLDNILLDAAGNVVLADFGLAYDFSNGDMAYGRFGTPGYCSPQVIGYLPYSCKADIYSLGVILQLMIYGTVSTYSYGKCLRSYSSVPSQYPHEKTVDPTKNYVINDLIRSVRTNLECFSGLS